MLVSFELSMPSNNSWNGRWTGESSVYARVINVGTSKTARAKWEKLIGYHTYSFGDGWRAAITVKECTSSVAHKLRKQSNGFCGYDWMIASLQQWGRILAEPPKTVLEFQGEEHVLEYSLAQNSEKSL
jgi:hypothetical protein